MSETYTGGCACGAIRYDISGEPVFTRTNVLVTQYWKGQLAWDRMKGTQSGNANCGSDQEVMRV